MVGSYNELGKERNFTLGQRPSFLSQFVVALALKIKKSLSLEKALCHTLAGRQRLPLASAPTQAQNTPCKQEAKAKEAKALLTT